MCWNQTGLVPAALAAVVCGSMVACTARINDDVDTVEVRSIELWQHGEPVPLDASRQAETAEVWIDPEPFELRFEGCRLRTTATFASDLRHGFVGLASDDYCGNPVDGLATFSRCNVVALEPDTHWIWHNPSDQSDHHWRVTLLDQRTGAEPLLHRPGWCRFVVEGMRLQTKAYEPLQTLDTDGDALLVSAWNDTDEDGWESIGELVHIYLQL